MFYSLLDPNCIPWLYFMAQDVFSRWADKSTLYIENSINGNGIFIWTEIWSSFCGRLYIATDWHWHNTFNCLMSAGVTQHLISRPLIGPYRSLDLVYCHCINSMDWKGSKSSLALINNCVLSELNFNWWQFMYSCISAALFLILVVDPLVLGDFCCCCLEKSPIAIGITG